jgi:hypothetical protein
MSNRNWTRKREREASDTLTTFYTMRHFVCGGKREGEKTQLRRRKKWGSELWCPKRMGMWVECERAGEREDRQPCVLSSYFFNSNISPVHTTAKSIRFDSIRFDSIQSNLIQSVWCSLGAELRRSYIRIWQTCCDSCDGSSLTKPMKNPNFPKNKSKQIQSMKYNFWKDIPILCDYY